MSVYRVNFKTVPPSLIELPRLVCAWCGLLVRDGNPAIDRTSHGICQACKAKEITRYLEGNHNG